MPRYVKLRKETRLPTAAARGQVRLYAKSDETLETVDDEGNREAVGGGGGTHATTHEQGGADEIDVTGLVGAGFNGTVDGSLIVNLDSTGPYEEFAVSVDQGVNVNFSVAATGAVLIQPPSGSTDSPLAIRTEAGLAALYIGVNGNAGFGAPLRANAGLVIYAPAAPADGDLFAGECALWYDSTDGAAKLRIKAKSDNGTVVTGVVNLT